MLRGQVQVYIEAPPEKVYAMLSDITRMGEWSPECYRCEWVDGTSSPSTGARFRGYSKSNWLKWSRLVEVRAAQPGKEFAFTTLTDLINKDSTNWRYTLEPSNGGTLLSESYEVTKKPSLPIRIVSFLARRPHDMRPHMEATLARIKEVAERGAIPNSSAQRVESA